MLVYNIVALLFPVLYTNKQIHPCRPTTDPYLVPVLLGMARKLGVIRHLAAVFSHVQWGCVRTAQYACTFIV